MPLSSKFIITQNNQNTSTLEKFVACELSRSVIVYAESEKSQLEKETK
nr:MAG TPA: hypothetical protein [Caudoviricetes sp.]